MTYRRSISRYEIVNTTRPGDIVSAIDAWHKSFGSAAILTSRDDFCRNTIEYEITFDSSAWTGRKPREQHNGANRRAGSEGDSDTAGGTDTAGWTCPAHGPHNAADRTCPQCKADYYAGFANQGAGAGGVGTQCVGCGAVSGTLSADGLCIQCCVLATLQRHYASLAAQQRTHIMGLTNGGRGYAQYMAQAQQQVQHAILRGTITGPVGTWARPDVPSGEIITGEIYAWRAWKVKGGYLHSCYVDHHIWIPGEPMEGEVGGAYHGLGVHAFKTRKGATEYALGHGDRVAIGRVKLWGDVVEHKEGYRAQYAKVHEIVDVMHAGSYVFFDPADVAKFHIPPRPDILGELRKRYGVETPQVA